MHSETRRYLLTEDDECGSRTRRRSADRRTMPRLSMRKSEKVRGRKWEVGMRKSEKKQNAKGVGQGAEVRIGKWECESRKKAEVGSRKGECGLRPLRAVGSLYEPEAIGAYAYAPVGSRKNNAHTRMEE
jgi:hypothetical protein